MQYFEKSKQKDIDQLSTQQTSSKNPMFYKSKVCDIMSTVTTNEFFKKTEFKKKFREAIIYPKNPKFEK